MQLRLHCPSSIMLHSSICCKKKKGELDSIMQSPDCAVAYALHSANIVIL